jgi:16S rRNA (guanine1516-N2)-methyltransferase
VPPPPPPLAVAFTHPRHRDPAEALATTLNLPIAKKFRDPHDLHLTVADDPTGHRLELRVHTADHPLAGGKGVAAQLTKLDTRSAAGRSLKSPLARAAGLKRGQRPDVFDATAGLGEDAWLLAAAGCRVTACERHPLVHALLADGLRRAAAADPDAAARLTLLPPADAADVLACFSPPAQNAQAAHPHEVVLLDPMFPGHADRKTAERKAMRVLRWLIGHDQDADRLLHAALAAATRRVAVKRPGHAPPLAGLAPPHQAAGRGFRYDVYPVNSGSDKSAIKDLPKV